MVLVEPADLVAWVFGWWRFYRGTYQAGATIKQVASEYDIGLTSLKRIIRERKASARIT